MRAGPSKVAVPERIAGAVDTRSLGVPHRKYAVIETIASPPRLLGSPDRGRCEILVHRRKETDIASLEFVFCKRELLIQSAQRRTAITGDITGCAQPGTAVCITLQHGQPNECLNSGDKNLPRLEKVFVLQRDLSQFGHWGISAGLFGVCRRMVTMLPDSVPGVVENSGRPEK